MSDVKIVHATPELQATNSSGRKKFWQGFVAQCDDGTVIHYTTSWQETASGSLSKKNRSEFTKVSGKNIGRANETTPLEQAVSELESLTNKKTDEGYHKEGEVSEVLPLPMLAHKFTERGKAITYPCFVQPKLDGHRALFDGEKFWTRKGKLYLPEVTQHLRFDTDGMILDGEIMLPPEFTFQETTSAIKKPNKNTPQLGYYVFDIVDGNNCTFRERIDALDILIGLGRTDAVPEQVRMVSTIMCESEDEIAGWLTKALKKGYEGLILRNAAGKYAIGQRSIDLQKLKDFVDEEFTIHSCVDGKGREAEAILYVCKTADGKEFTVRPEGSIKERKQLWYDFCTGSYSPQGAQLTVRYQNLTDEGLPRFPVGVAVRDYE
jgi:ATP-dependent DNA ligase